MSSNPQPQSGSKGLGKILFLALLTGGMSLVWLALTSASSLWDKACLARAEWLKAKESTKPWGWVGRGWMAAGASLFGILPSSMMLAGVLSLGMRNTHYAPGMPLPLRALVVGMIPTIAFMIVLGQVATMLFHTARAGSFEAWRMIRSPKTI